MDGVYYNQEVTEEVLNAMATDLGATSFNEFDGVTKFGANELNKITKDLVEKGILISGDMCRCVKTDTGIIIQTGTIVFANGAKKTISSPVEITVENGKCVYALNDISKGICTIEVENNFPTDTETDYVALCEISSYGDLSDKRIVAKARVELTAKSKFETEFTFSIGSFTEKKTVGTIDRKVWDFYDEFLMRIGPAWDGLGFAFIKKEDVVFGSRLVNLGYTVYVFLEEGEGVINVKTMKSADYEASLQCTLKMTFI